MGMDNNQELVAHLKRRGVLETPAIIAAFEAVDRVHFVRPHTRREAYGDHPLSIGHGQTISQPYTVAFMLEKLQPLRGQQILDVGSGSGWTTALLSYIVGAEGAVKGTEIVADLVRFGRENLAKFDFPQGRIDPAEETVGRCGEQFDRILVSAAAHSIPTALVNQLERGGRLVIPVQSSIYRVIRDQSDRVREEEFYGFSFVPLIVKPND
jgi:protein-L-isoaspartate(D-aspartate) O-methyltransferase